MVKIMKSLKEDKLYQLLLRIKERPLMYLREKSLTELDAYIAGFVAGILENNRIMNETNDFCIFTWYRDFCRYVKDICGNESKTCGEVSAIFEKGYDEKSGFDYYYELLDDFVRKKCYETGSVPQIQMPNVINKEIRAFKLNKIGINMMTYCYIDEHYKELFDLIDRVDKLDLVTDVSCKLKWGTEDCVCIVYDKRLEITEEMEEKVEEKLDAIDYLDKVCGYKTFKYDDLI